MAVHNEFLPLREYIGRDTIDYDRFREFKVEETAKEFCEVADCEFLIEVLEECYAIKYDEEPNYDKIKFIMKNALLEERIVPGGRYDSKRRNGPNLFNFE